MTASVAKTFTVSSKVAKHGDWKTDEGFISVHYEVQDGMSNGDLKREIMLRKEQVDLLCLTAEFAKGRMMSAEYAERKKYLTQAYDRILGRNSEAE